MNDRERMRIPAVSGRERTKLPPQAHWSKIPNVPGVHTPTPSTPRLAATPSPPGGGSGSTISTTRNNMSKGVIFLGPAIIMAVVTCLHLYGNRAEDNRQAEQHAYNQTRAGQQEMLSKIELARVQAEGQAQVWRARAEYERAKNLDGGQLVIYPNNGRPAPP